MSIRLKIAGWVIARPLRAFVAPALLVFIGSFVSSTPAMAGVVDTVHNLGFYSPGTVKSSDTTEVCIFCHTPHSASPNGPIWNRNNSGATYTFYTTETMVSNPSVPTGSSKLCLSCHDGTIALGSLLNLPGAFTSGTLAVAGTTGEGKLLTSSTSNLGTDLSDDHPVSFAYSAAYPDNVEINDSATLPSEYSIDGNGELQCTSCHDPHGTAYDNFLVGSLSSAALCTTCHDKNYWTGSIHDTNESTWAGAGTNPWREDMLTAGYTDDDLKTQKCLGCHRSHSGAAAMHLTAGYNPSVTTEVGEEWTCLHCHDGNPATEDIEALLDGTKLSSHPVMGASNYAIHQADRNAAGEPVREAAATLDDTNRHSECSDCHNPHGAKSGNHTIGGTTANQIGNNLFGGWGVKPTTWPNDGIGADNVVATANYSVIDFDSTTPATDKLEGYMCIKCHASYAYGTNKAFLPDVPSGNADDSTVVTSDMTGDFNINNLAFHPVFAQGNNRPPIDANSFWASGGDLTQTFWYTDWTGTPGEQTGFYAVEHDSKMTCSDCHASDTSTDPQGPHGSDNKWILRGNESGSGTSDNLCFNCHRRKVYGDEDYQEGGSPPKRKFSRVDHPADGLGTNSPFYKSGTNTGNSSNWFGNLCLTCHGGAYDSTDNQMKGIHGSNAAAGAQGGSDALGYRMMNGACVESYTRPSRTTNGTIWFRSVSFTGTVNASPSTDEVCNYNFSTVTITTERVQYNCSTIADCSN